MFKNMTARQVATSKAIAGAVILVGAGGFIMFKGDYALGVATIGAGLSIAGIRDAQA